MPSIKSCKWSVAIAAATVVLASCSIGKVLPVPATYYAKELCSCLFVVGQSEAYCRPYAQEDIARGAVLYGTRSNVSRRW